MAKVLNPRSSPHVTELLVAWSDGDDGALQKLTSLIERELHRLAAAYMAHERPDHLLQPTALVNEAYLRLIDWKQVRWQNRAHFFGVAAQMMRHVLVDIARAHHREKRGGREAMQVSLSDAKNAAVERSTDLVELDDALKTLARLDARQARVVELRFFGGLSHEETAHVLSVSVATVRRDGRLARAWQFRELHGRARH